MIATLRLTRTLSLIGTLFLIGVCFFVPRVSQADSATDSTDWPRWGGPNMDFSVDGVEIDANTALEVAWQQKLGSSYAGLVVSSGKVITGVSDGESDFLVALSTADGNEVWRHRIAETYKGHDGSADGILATPAVDDQAVYVLGGWGHLVAVRTSDGERLWTRRIDEDFKGTKPHFGFTTAPLLVGDLVVIQAGGEEGKSIVALDRKTGEERWSTGDDPISYQSPTLFRLGDEIQIIAVSDRFLLGLNPQTGEELWRHSHGEGNRAGSAQPVQLGDKELLLNYQSGVKLLHLKKQGEDYVIEEQWTSQALRRSYNVPVLHEGYLYGYNSRFLTCVDAATGERVWRSRPPGSGGLILVDGHLLVFGGEGDVVLVKATPDGYQEKARVKALELGSLTAPSFASGQVFVRNLEGVASVRLAAAQAAPRQAEEEIKLKGEFGAFIKGLHAAEDKKAKIDEFMAAQKSFPIIEGDQLVHLVFRGDVEDLAVKGNLNQDREEPMHRFPGTDFFYRTFELEPATLHSYQFLVFEKSMADPLNSAKMGPEGREFSLLHMPGWSTPEHLAKEPTEKGKVEEWTWKSESLGNERPVKVYLPPSFTKGEKEYPLLLVYQGQGALDIGRLDRALDNLIGSGKVEPLVAAFVSRRRWSEFAGTMTNQFSGAVVGELLPELEKRYGVSKDASRRAIWGTEAGGFAALFTALEPASALDNVIVQSFINGDLQANLLARLEERKEPLKLYAEWSRNDLLQPTFGYDAAAQTEAIANTVAAAEHQVNKVEVGDSPGWESWTTRADEILTAFFPAP